MNRNYSPKTFLRQTPNPLLKEYFRRKTLLSDIEFDKLDETEIDSIAEAIKNLLDNERNGIEADFRSINEMACAKGVQILIEEAESPHHKLNISAALREMKNHYERAFWVFLNHPDVFGIASNFSYMDRVGSWRRHTVGEGFSPAITEKDKDNLANGVSEFYQKQGRGKLCHVDNYLRQKPERHCYFVYPEDYVTTELGFNEKGEFYHWPRKPVLEVIFVYRPETGILEVNAKGKKDDIEELQEIFCKTILGLDGLPRMKQRQFDLSKLNDKTKNFATDPTDGIEKVTITMLRLDLPGVSNRRITFEASPSGEGQPVHALIEKALNKSNFPSGEIRITRAKIQIRFAPIGGKRSKTLTFEISAPDRWTLKDDPLDQIAKKCLVKWGLVSG